MPHPRLLELRQQIDAVDSQLQELLIQRTALTQEVGALKRSTPSFVNRGQFMYPGREALIQRRLVYRHHGAMPVQALMQLWREIMMATLCVLEQPFTCGYVNSHTEDDDFGAGSCARLARDHFGVCVPMRGFDHPSTLIQAVQQKALDYAVLPWPGQQGAEAWWQELLPPLPSDQTPLRVFFALPFYPPLNAATSMPLPQAAVVGALPYDDLTDLDDSLVAIAIPKAMPVQDCLGLLQSITPSAQCLAVVEDSPPTGQGLTQQWLCLQLAGAFVPGGQLWHDLETALQGVAMAIHPLGLYPR
ncbi:MAG: hypothetical protein FJX22_04605, partial [Alphaproteobacteria bacterium]|nr:hypothetical protein [Alphaproteobacteria bacterium]